MDASRPAHLPPRYLPAVVSTTATVKYSSRKVSIATEAEPDRVCGQALRVGYTGPLQTDLAIYRLRIKSSPELPANTLSGFFVLKNGIFRAYER